MVYRILALLLILLPALVSAQSSYQELHNLQYRTSSLDSINSKFSEEQKLNFLQATYLEEDSIQFEYPDYDPDYPEDPRYFPLRWSDFYLMDLNDDDQLDLVYSGPSGWNGLMGTKIYLQKESRLELIDQIQGGLLDIVQQERSTLLHTTWVPCCDSYTSRIETYEVNSDKVERVESISVIGRIRLQGYPHFDGLPDGQVLNPQLWAIPEDFRQTHPYFRERNRELRDSLKRRANIPLIELDGNLLVKILAQKEIRGIKMRLILTPPLDNIPKSIYEWSVGDKRRFIGWVVVEN